MSGSPRGNPLQRLPLPALLVVVAALWIALRLVFSHEPVTPLTVGVRVGEGLLYGTVLTVVIGLRRRRLGGTDASVVFLRAVRTGEVPVGVDSARWRSELERTDRMTRRQRWIIRVGWLLPLGLGVWGLTEADSRALGGLLVVLAVAALVAGEVGARRQLARVERLRSAITG